MLDSNVSGFVANIPIYMWMLVLSAPGVHGVDTYEVEISK